MVNIHISSFNRNFLLNQETIYLFYDLQHVLLTFPHTYPMQLGRLHVTKSNDTLANFG